MSLGEDLHEAALPAVDCLDRINFYFEAQLENGLEFLDPAGAPTNTYGTVAALGTALAFSDDMEGDVSAWTVVSDPSLQSGEWEQANPNETSICRDSQSSRLGMTRGAISYRTRTVEHPRNALLYSHLGLQLAHPTGGKSSSRLRTKRGAMFLGANCV